VQIGGAMGQLSKATQQNASASEELAATSEELSGQAEQLQQSIAFFNIDAEVFHLPERQRRAVSAVVPRVVLATPAAEPITADAEQPNFQPY